MMSFEKSLYPAALANSGACNITFVDPPTDIATIRAFLIESLVTISLGVISSFIIFDKYSISWLGNSSSRRVSWEAGDTI